MTVERDVLLARSLRDARRQVRGCITTLERVRGHLELKSAINAMLARLRANHGELTAEFNNVKARLRARLPAPKAVTQ
jgi:hypothetical protein